MILSRRFVLALLTGLFLVSGCAAMTPFPALNPSMTLKDVNRSYLPPRFG